MGDRLARIFQTQRCITEDVLQELGQAIDGLSHDELTELSKFYILAMHKELSEVLDNVDGWKPHRPSSGEHNRTQIVEESIDIQKYLIGFLLLWGVSPGEFFEAFMAKSKIVAERWEQDRKTLADNQS